MEYYCHDCGCIIGDTQKNMAHQFFISNAENVPEGKISPMTTRRRNDK